MQVTVYSTHTCPWCVRAKDYLRQKGIPFREVYVDDDYQAAIEMVRKSGQQGVPVIEVDGQIVVGFDRPRLERLLADAESGRVPFGAAVADASKILMQRGQIPIFGAFVGRVSPGSPAHRAGLAAGDIITELNLRRIANANDVESALQSLQRGARVSVVFMRGDQTLRSEVVL